MISVFLSGRLGNQMFQYSICRVVAEKNNYDFHIPRTGSQGHHIKDFFPNLYMGLNTSEIRHRFVEDHSIQKFDERIFSLKDYTQICGFYQSPKYFENYRNKIKEWFSFDLNETTSNLLKKFNPDNYCFIHVRGTDYKHHGHWLLGKEYYEKAMEHMKRRNDKISFVIVSDDPTLCNSWFPDIECLKNEMMVDYKLLFESKYLIIPNSTFSWWPAWLSTKNEVIAPNFWLNYNKPESGFYPFDIKTEEFTYI